MAEEDVKEEIHSINIGVDQMALWIYTGITGYRPPDDMSVETAINELDPEARARCRVAAITVLDRMVEYFLEAGENA